MKITRKNVIPLLVFILSAASLIRLFNISIITASFSPWFHGQAAALVGLPTNNSAPTTTNLSNNEIRFLSDLISKRAPCNLLIFGLEPHYFDLISMLNVGGFTLFLDDKLNTETMNNNTRVQKVEYETRAEEAYELLRDARDHPQLCSPLMATLTTNSSRRRRKMCRLATGLLTRLSQQVFETDWDAVLVDGPSGHEAGSPGRMAAIYAAGVLARKMRRKSDDEKMMGVDVVVHDVDRMIERWFSWEFLCAHNLVASKGRFWNFRIRPSKSNANKFC